MSRSDLYMEDVHSIGLKAMDVIEQELKKFDIKLDDKEEDEIYVPLCEKLENIIKVSDYRNYN